MGFLLLCVRDCMEGFNSGFLAVGLTFVLCLLQDCCFMVWHYFSLGGMHWAWLSFFFTIWTNGKRLKNSKNFARKRHKSFLNAELSSRWGFKIKMSARTNSTLSGKWTNFGRRCERIGQTWWCLDFFGVFFGR